MYVLPTEKSSKLIDLMKLTKEQVVYIKENRTTELPQSMFNRAIARGGLATGTTMTEDGRRRRCPQPNIDKLEFMGFTLTKSFPQNVCMMRDGSVVFCDEFLLIDPLEGDGDKPTIRGFRFQKVKIIL